MNILIFHLGQLGDTLIALPAFRAVRRHYPETRLTLLNDQHVGKFHVLASDLLQNSNLFDAFEAYPVDKSTTGRFLRPLAMLRLMARLRSCKFDTLVYLGPSIRSARQVKRDRWFFTAAGIRHFVGMDGFHSLPTGKHPLPAIPHETDLLLARLAASGLDVPAAGQAGMGLELTATDEAEVDRWLAPLPPDLGRPWIGVGPGSKMPAKRWPVERFAQVVSELDRPIRCLAGGLRRCGRSSDWREHDSHLGPRLQCRRQIGSASRSGGVVAVPPLFGQ